MFLANRLIALGEAPRETQLKAAEKFRAANFAIYRQKYSAAEATRLSAEIVTEVLEDLPKIAKKIRNSMRFKLDPSVEKALKSMRKTPEDTLIKAFQFAKPPYPSTWIEGGNNDSNWGWIIEQNSKNDPIRIRGTTATKETDYFPFYREMFEGVFTESGIQLPDFDELQHIKKNVLEAYRLLLLINSRSPLLRTGDAIHENIYHQNQLKKKFNARACVNIQPIELDISRTARKAGVSAEQARELAFETIVMGHFKIRKTGAFWWSPHVRNPAGSTREGLLAHKERTIINSEPSQEP